jgi:4-amino-4-deoxy-L-arabinose transferase-like glycosyltransferase
VADRILRDRAFGLRLAAIAAGGLVLRLLYVLVLSPDTRGEGDARYYHDEANLLADGMGYIDPLQYALFGEVKPTAFRPPLYPYLLSAVSRAGGDDWTAHRIVGCVIGVATIVLIGLAALRYAGRRAGLIAAALAACYPVLIAADGAVMSETPYTALVAAAILLAVRLHDRPAAVTAAALGAVIGLAALTRSEALALLPLLALPLAWRAGPGARLQLAAAATVAMVLVLTPWTVRNYVRFDRVLPVTGSYGFFLIGANCPGTYWGTATGAWLLDCVPRGPDVPEDELERADRNQDLALEFIGDHLDRAPVVAAVRVLRTFDAWEPFEQARNAEGREPLFSQVGVVSWYLLIPFGLYGAIVLRRRRRPLPPMAVMVGLVVFVSATGWGVPRFRAAVEVPLVICAGVALAQLPRARAPAQRR